MQPALRLLIVLLISALTIIAMSAQDDTLESVIAQFTDPVEASGEVLIVYGRVLDSAGNPLAGVAVEIWQTDSHGVYDHPNTQTANIDTGFQHFGSSVTDESGLYTFRTIVPSSEGVGRPLHIHVKVKNDGEEVLTTQFYFADDIANAQSDQFFRQAGENADLMILQPEESTAADGSPVLVASKDIVVSTGISGALALTPSQTEGPFYPVVDVSEYDHDLTVVSDQSEIEFTLLNLNTATADELMSIPGMGNRMVRAFEEDRPYASISQFRREIGKYVDQTQVAAYEAYVYVPINPNESDAESLKQIPGVDDLIAAELIAARPFGSNAAFLEVLAMHLSSEQLELARHYLVAQE